MSAICEGGSGTTRPDIPEVVSGYVTADRSETFAACPTSLEINPNSNSTNLTTSNSEPSTFHTTIPKSFVFFCNQKGPFQSLATYCCFTQTRTQHWSGDDDEQQDTN